MPVNMNKINCPEEAKHVGQPGVDNEDMQDLMATATNVIFLQVIFLRYLLVLQINA